MIFWFVIFLFLFIILFFISKVLLKNLYQFLYLVSKNQIITVHLLTWLLLPGTIIHEVSHMLVAEVLGIKTGKFNFRPKIAEDQKIKAGSIQISKPDPFRHALIGLAPVFTGLGLIFSLIHFLFLPLTISYQPSAINHQSLAINHLFLLFTACYLLFIISNTMFSSRQDLKTILFPIILITTVIAFSWYAGIRIKISFSRQLTNTLNQFFSQLNLGLGIAILTNLFFWGIIRGIKSLFGSLKS